MFFQVENHGEHHHDHSEDRPVEDDSNGDSVGASLVVREDVREESVDERGRQVTEQIIGERCNGVGSRASFSLYWGQHEAYKRGYNRRTEEENAP